MKKSFLSFVLIFSILSTLIATLPITVSAATNGTCGDNLTWNLDDNGTLTISGSGNMTDFSFFEHAPWHTNSFVKRVVINEGVTSIGNYAFFGTNSIVNVMLPNSITSIGICAFNSCCYITDIKIPKSVSYIGEQAFSNCSQLTNVEFMGDLKSVNNHLFYNCTNLKFISIPEGVESIGQQAFDGCSNLISIYIPQTVTSIGNFVFRGCDNLNIYYGGDAPKWAGINISSYGKNFIDNATIHYDHSFGTQEKNYSVKFNLNGGSGVCPEQEILEGGYVDAPDKPTREGYIFTGWYANKICSGQPYITSNGMVNKKVTNNMILYAGWKKTDLIEWGKDTFKFGNTIYFWGNSYSISDEYYNILTKDLGAYDKYCMRVQKNKNFGGSCYGMSVAMAMFEQGLMTPHFVWSGAKNVHDIPYPKNDIRVASLINYYQLSQNLPSINKKLNNQSKMGTEYLSKELVNALWNVKSTGVPVVIGYEYKDGWKWCKHAVLAYKVEEDGLYYKVHIADPNNLAHTIPTSNGVIVEDTEPSYMYIDNDWSNISYKGSEGIHSFADNTLKLFCVLDDDSLYQSINIQEKLTNQCMGTSNYSLMLVSLDEPTAVSQLTVNFDEFSIDNGLENVTISKDGINGDLEISDGTANYGDNHVSYDLPYSEQYTVTPSAELDDCYESTIVFEDEHATFMSAKSEKIATFDFSNNGMIKILSDEKCGKTISYSAQNSEWLLGGIEVSANVSSLELEVLGEGRYHINSSSSLKDAVVSIIDLDGNKTSVVVFDDVLEFVLTYSQLEQQYVISFEGTNNDEQITKSSTVVFYANGGNSIESISDIEYGDKIKEPECPVYEGFIFDGWYVDEEFTTEWDFETDVVTDNLNLYAKWEEDPDYYRTMTFVNSDETMQVIVRNGETVRLEEYVSLFDEKEYAVLGWNTDGKESNVEYAEDTTLVIDNDITLYAVLKKVVPYTDSTVIKSSTSCKVETSIYNVSGSCNIIVVGYKNKQFVSLQSKPYSQPHETFNLSNDIDEIKVMLWDGLTKLKPLCDAEVITCEQWANNQ